MTKSNIFFFCLGIAASIAIINSCKISYSFSGASIPPEVETFMVEEFENRAPSFQPKLAYLITNELKDKIQNETRLKLVNKDADVTFRGTITNYQTKPVSIGGDNRATKNRITITVKVKYIDKIEPKNNFDKTFSRYEDFDSDKTLTEVEEEKNQEIVEQLNEDIFKQAFVNW
jgi:hypothetical protein